MVERILNCQPSKDMNLDWTLDEAWRAGLVSAAPGLPDQVDLRADWWEIGDQGATGSCVGWATADSVCRWHMVHAGRINPQDRLSVRYVWMAAKESDEFALRPTSFIEHEGTSLKAALDVARKFGLVPDADLPFGSGSLYRGELMTFYAGASRLRISSYYNLGRRQMSWRKWLAIQGPILARLDVDDTWEKATETGGNLEAYQYGSEGGGHAVAIVGYLASGYFIVRNSWGQGWGDKGYAYASKNYAQAAFTECYGVIV